MVTLRALVVAVCVLALVPSCAKHNAAEVPTCGHGIDPSDPQCNKPQCSDGIDNDGDGLIDYPNDPGCFSPNQDSEVDDCPDGPNCPECGNHKDDDGNGLTDFAGGDPGCSAASDTDEWTDNPVACGASVQIQQLPPNNEVMGMFVPGMINDLASTRCGGTGMAIVYELRIKHPKVIVASTDFDATTTNTVLALRTANCTSTTTEIACSDDLSPTNAKSTITASLQPGTYYLIVSSHDASVSGPFDLQVHFFVGEGVACQTGDDCGPGLVCRVPTGGMQKVCSKHECSDGIDNDGDGLVDYPNDPGCASPQADSELDDCPNGPNCPECGNHVDDNRNGKTDYPQEPNCTSAASTSEWCVSHTAVVKATTPMLVGDTTGAASDYQPTCGFGTGVPDNRIRLDVPALDSLTVSAASTWTSELALLDHTCAGTALQCSSGSFTQTNLAAGTYFVVVDGDGATDFGPYTLTFAGKIKNGQSCESALARSGALSCNASYTCKGAIGARTCQRAQCSDGVDNNGDGKVDYPNDPGCTDPSDDTEDTVCPGANCPVCSNRVDDNNNGLTDWPAEWGCTAASGSTERFCAANTNANPTKITTKTTMGTTVGHSFDASLVPSCRSTAMSPELVYGLQLPVPVASLQVDTIGSSFDTVLAIRDANCMMEVPGGCDDDGGGSLTSKIVLTNMGAGGYAIIVDGFSSLSGAFKLNVRGTVAAGTPCTSPLFSGAANAVLVCPTACTAGVCH